MIAWLLMDRGQVRVMLNLGDRPVELENKTGFRLLLRSGDDIALRDGKVFLPSSRLAVLSAE